MELMPIANTPAYLKAGFFGFPKSGKTYSSLSLAIGLRQALGLTGPIAMFDTEGGSAYQAARVKRTTGLDLLGVQSRAFDDLMAWGKACMEQNVSVGIVDSITHVWRELMEAYAKRANVPVSNMPLRVIMGVKQAWAPWPDWFLTSPMHLIICGRAGFEWGEEEDDSGRMKLVKTGTKMKAEAEFAFEPSLLVEMSRERDAQGNPRIHRATVIGDRFGVMDGSVCDDPGFEFFLPHVELLHGGQHQPVKTESTSQPDTGDDGAGQWAKEKKARTIAYEQIKALMDKQLGNAAEDRKLKIELTFALFGTRSKTQVEELPSDVLNRGLKELDWLFATPAAWWSFAERVKNNEIIRDESGKWKEWYEAAVVEAEPLDGSTEVTDPTAGETAPTDAAPELPVFGDPETRWGKDLHAKLVEAARVYCDLPEEAVDEWLKFNGWTRASLDDKDIRGKAKDSMQFVQWEAWDPDPAGPMSGSGG